jgi:hypothetical protein
VLIVSPNKIINKDTYRKQEHEADAATNTTKMTLISSLCSFPPIHSSSPFSNSALTCSTSNLRIQFQSYASSINICTQKIDTSLITIAESFYDDEFWAASSLRVRSFNQFRPDTYGVQVSFFTPFFFFQFLLKYEVLATIIVFSY